MLIQAMIFAAVTKLEMVCQPFRLRSPSFAFAGKHERNGAAMIEPNWPTTRSREPAMIALLFVCGCGVCGTP